jgi:hypothetical protein
MAKEKRKLRNTKDRDGGIHTNGREHHMKPLPSVP